MNEEWKKVRPEKLFVVFGFTLMAISVFLPWLSAQSIFNISLSRTGLDFYPEGSYLALFFFISGSLTVWFYDSFKRSGIICLLMSIWMLVEVFYVYPQLQDRVNSSTNYIITTIGSGIYLLAIGAVLSLIGSLKVLTIRNVQNGLPAGTMPNMNPQHFAQPIMGQRFCPQCGRFLQEEVKFCPHCGKVLG